MAKPWARKLQAGGAPPVRPAVLYGGMPTVNPNLADYLTLNAKTAPRALDLLMMFNGWAGPLVYGGQEGYADALGAQMIIAWQPSANVQGTANDGTLGNVASGVLDAYLDAQIATVKAYPKPIIVRLAHEFNGNWTSYGNTRESAGAFIAGWQYVVDRFRNAGVSNVLWCWSPSTWGRRAKGPIVDPTPFWPGDAYVDLVGLDGYQNKLNPVVDWPADVFLANYQQVVAMTDKPIVIAEVGVAEDARFSKKDWYNQLFALVRDKMPRCVAVCVWSRTDDPPEGDYSLDSSGTNAAALAAFLRGVNSVPMAVPGGQRTAGWDPQRKASPARSPYAGSSPAWAPDGVSGWNAGSGFKVKEENYSRFEITGNDIALPGGQLLAWVGPTLREQEKYTKFGVMTGSQAAVTPTHCVAALFDLALNLLGISADLTNTAFGATGLYGLWTFPTIQRPVETPTIAAAWQVAATPMNLRGKVTQNVPMAASPRGSGVGPAGLTDAASLLAVLVNNALPAALAAPATTNVLPWCAVG